MSLGIVLSLAMSYFQHIKTLRRDVGPAVCEVNDPSDHDPIIDYKNLPKLRYVDSQWSMFLQSLKSMNSTGAAKNGCLGLPRRVWAGSNPLAGGNSALALEIRECFVIWIYFYFSETNKHCV